MSKETKTAKKTATKIARKTVRKNSTKQDECYTYDTPMRVLEKKLDIKLDVPPDTKLGDFFKDRGYDSFSRILKML